MEGVAGDKGPEEVGRESTHWGQAGDIAEGTEGVVDGPCPDGAHGEEGGPSSYEQAVGMRRWQAVTRLAVASAWGAGPGRPGVETWQWQWQ